MKTHCKYGHKRTKENTYIPSGRWPVCRICRRLREKELHKNRPWIKSFYDAKARCQNKNNKSYCYYGDKGRKFLLTMAEIKSIWFRDGAFSMSRPSIDRIDNHGDYTYLNCRFMEIRENISKDTIGEKNPFSKLTEKKVRKIRLLRKKGVRGLVLAKQFKVSYGTIRDVVSKKRWKHI